MPIYEYQCSECGRGFETLVRSDKETPACPSCGSDRVERRMSEFSSKPSPFSSGRGFGGCGSGGFS